MMRVLYLGSLQGTSRHRFQAFERAGCQVLGVDPAETALGRRVSGLLEWKVAPELAALLFEASAGRWLRQLPAVDLLFVDNGALVSPTLLRRIKRRFNCPMVLFNHDDFMGPRDGIRFRQLHRALPLYDDVIVVRHPNVEEAYRAGARRVTRRFMTFDRVAHHLADVTDEERLRWNHDVAFVGTWMPGRCDFMLMLASQGLNVSIFGSGWQKSPRWAEVRTLWRGPALGGRDYALALALSKVSVGLLSKGNRDQHTTRSFEIPALGGVLCAERTDDHRAIFVEGCEALFWGDALECAVVCKTLINDPQRRAALALAGQQKVLQGSYSNDDLVASVLATHMP